VDALAGVTALNPGSPVVVSSEGANQTVAGTCQDLAGNAAATIVGPINLDKTKPVADVTANPSVVPLNTGFTVNATVTDLGSGAASAEYRLDNGPYSGLTLTNSATGLWSDSLPPLSVGVYTICARSIDRAGIQGDETCVLVPVYDPTGGFVTGGGWITSPPGAYAPSPSLTGKASFAFSAKYQHGANLPSGDTQFRFQAADFLFRSSTYQWLVVAGARAQFKGSGTINGSGDYQFLLTAIDGEVPGGGGEDKFRIKIWNAGGVVYDNKMGSDDGGNDATTLGGGSIVIHK
jgi:hypothetical protein